MGYTRKQLRRGGGQGKSKPAAAGPKTPAQALKHQVGEVVSFANKLKQTAKQIDALRREKESVERQIRLLKSSIETRTKLSHSSRNTLKSKQDELAAAEKRLGEIRAALGEQEEVADSAAAGVGLAASAIEGIGEHGEHVLGRRIEAAEAASAAANIAGRNLEYAGLSNSARKRVHNADRRATRIATKRDLAGLVKKYKKTVKQLHRLSKDLARPHASNELDKQADYLRRFSDELLKRIGDKNKNSGAYLNAALYNPKSASPISPNSPSDPNSV